ncbi:MULTISPECIES: UDP-glucose 4-epimerase GalE [Bacillus]|uniref:UDP-glucose 4-epimerase n=1 Tax=Bacillus glycinifermentans TaxID=1664069 RepID=A0AAJ3YXN9_9BACI|nr:MULTISPECIES: UDP-glucose 4-epimerase GalE [Bacillus]KKB73310.1 UDP-glucose 4-epimerase [Bacillus sp. TH008]MDU0069515.1 UDP-glucose 4-epimerase GalE [Bacillus sp. IG6]MEC3606662.1 UDP-glucose 4-epimerase GalE [Bacillus glycinifermentans]MED8017506.1 UDP-glucose 4-epimerase GalE [Bacillus glycinifermentans]QAT64653.1 UDP-glucose 4-epimerase GalE [Bacillus glycinifermentans]
MKSVLVTGGAGYIGSHTVLELKNRNITAVVLDNLSTGHREAVHTPHFYEGDISDCGLVKSIIRKHNIDAVIHFAAKSLVSESIEKPELYFRENTIKSCSFFETIIQEGVKHIVFSSTAAVYGITGDKPIRETAPLEPVNPYGESKLMIEKYLHWVEKRHNVKWAALRYFNAAGAALDGFIGEDHDPESHLIPLILQTALGHREKISIFGDDYPTPDGTCIRDYIHVLDLAAAHLSALGALYEDRLVQNVYNVGTGAGHSVKEMIETSETITERNIPKQTDKRRAGDPPVLVADSRALQEHTGWKPKYSDLQTIIQSAWAWHTTHPSGF